MATILSPMTSLSCFAARAIAPALPQGLDHAGAVLATTTSLATTCRAASWISTEPRRATCISNCPKATGCISDCRQATGCIPNCRQACKRWLDSTTMESRIQAARCSSDSYNHACSHGCSNGWSDRSWAITSSNTSNPTRLELPNVWPKEFNGEPVLRPMQGSTTSRGSAGTRHPH